MEFSPPPAGLTKRLSIVVSFLSLLVLLIAINRYRKVVVEHNLQSANPRLAGASNPVNAIRFQSPTTPNQLPASTVQKTDAPTTIKSVDSRPYSGAEKVLPTTKVKGEADCKDPNFPHFDPKTSTCVECFESSFNCLTGFQRCYQGRCVVKNSPQCSYYPVGGTGGAIQVQ